MFVCYVFELVNDFGKDFGANKISFGLMALLNSQGKILSLFQSFGWSGFELRNADSVHDFIVP